MARRYVQVGHVTPVVQGGQSTLPVGGLSPAKPKAPKPHPAPTPPPARPQFAFPFLEPQLKPKGRHVLLRVVQERCGTFDSARPGLPPGGRDECRDGPRPCPYVRCKHHLWLVQGEDRAGRRGHGKLPSTELEPRWLDPETRWSCALDFANAVEPGETASIAEIGAALGRDDSSVWLELESALEKLRALGVDVLEALR